MIEKVHLKYFKQFKDQSFKLDGSAVLAGPNNTGKTTLFQAIATWHFAYREWQKRKGSTTRSKQRGGVALTRKEFLSIPMQSFNLLWTDTSTALKKEEGGGRGAATPRIIEITLEGGSGTGSPWSHTMEFRYANTELIYAKPGQGSSLPNGALSVVYVPPFSGIEIEEKIHAPEYQEWLIGQGKPGDIIRNLLAEVSLKSTEWEALSKDIERIFRFRLLKPEHKGRPFILCQYLPGIPQGSGLGGLPKLDIASAGSGFLQTLLLLAFFYARPSTVLLVDEPDAHLHVNLQREIHKHLIQLVAGERKCQIIVATHSEVIIDNTSHNRITSFYGSPHRLTHDVQRDEVREALKRLSTMDILQSKDKKILYVEANSDFNILSTFAKKLDHPLEKWFSSPYYYPIQGNNPREAKNHFFALKAIYKDMKGVLLLDGDNRNLKDHEVATNGLEIIRWKRYEIESYLIHPDLLKRFVEKHLGPLFVEVADEQIHEIIPLVTLKNPLGSDDYLQTTKASETLLPKIIDSSLVPKSEYYKIAAEMKKTEIPHEVSEVLDIISKHWNLT